ncbi:MAG: glycosyl hydrolase, partial [Nocardioides sp.]|uniref:glycosyl hydrolase n=1 Tax=Nocardioides sp. TaxID=35761 RepID=UPI0039E50E49
VLQGAAAASVAVAAPAVPAESASAARKKAHADPWLRQFAAPVAARRPRVRWWLPDADLDQEMVRDQVASLASAGVGGAELANLGDGFGTAQWQRDVLTALQAARRHDLDLDLTVGPSWPAAVPTIDLNSNQSAQGIFWGVATVAAGDTFDDAVPASVTAAADGVTAQTLIAVVAARIAVDSSADAEPVVLDRSTAVVLSDRVSDGRIAWTAPADGGTWQLISFWQRSEGKTVGDWPVVNHFDRSGARAVTDYWDDVVLTPRIRRLIATGSAQLFEDSIELTQSTHWTDGLIEIIEKRRGYDIAPHLPVLMVRFDAIFDLAKVFAYADGSDDRLRNDYYEVLSELYVEGHLRVLRDWAHGVGMRFRAQPAYGATMDMQYAALVPDVPETESLWFAEKVDAYRSMSAAAHIPGRDVFSVETDVVVPPKVGDDGYAITFPGVLNLLHGHFAGFINQIVLHGYPYPTATDATWPGYSPFASVGGGIGESWGPRNPNWHHMKDLTDYLGRLQTVLQSGRASVDVAVYRHAYWDRGRDNWDLDDALLWNDPKLRSAGYSYEYLDPHLLDLPQSVVRKGRLAPNGPAYRALVLTDVAEVGASAAVRPASNSMTLARARQLLRFARAGLPIVIVGELPSTTPFESDRSDDAKVAALLVELAGLPTTQRVAAQAGVPAALRRLGVLPDAQFRESVDHVWNVHRRVDETGEVDLYYLYNEGAESTEDGYVSSPVPLDLSLNGAGVPYRLDAWTGAVEPVTSYARRGGRVRLSLDLASHEAAVIALAPPGWTGSAGAPERVVSTTADSVVSRQGRLLLRATKAGRYRTRLSRSGLRITEVAAVPTTRRVTRWQLTVTSYEPGASADQTTYRTVRTTVHGLRPWADIDELSGVSGIGRYTSGFRLPADWQRHDGGARIRLGTIANSARVWVNGRRLESVDLITGTVEARDLRPGENTITVEVTTTLSNQLRTLSGGEGRAELDDGLLGVGESGAGAVLVEPFREVRLR